MGKEQRVYAECYNLAETEKKIELRNQRDGSGKFSISIAQHDMLRTLDGYVDEALWSTGPAASPRRL